ncbi:Response regulator receiver domain-containing protein [Alkalispirochaeta americana]|uniref:Response regulator receiver domain-containing protein n=1 Tax=Alkalispirochaeta americana TaxID=159291 RepID=A0A1N6N604_9SPIO|nr:response regulator [Alkalispirochaeta americana]SIP87514.1 Response regulator receiver domain-containing protein [Alkalispirochaeta americana]
MAERSLAVLIVEDEVFIALHLALELEAEGHCVVDRVASGQEALRCLRSRPVDLVLMDIGLAGPLDGIQTAGQIRDFSRVPIVFMTGYADRLHQEAVTAVDPLGCLVKPAGVRELKPLLERASTPQSSRTMSDRNASEEPLG